MINQRQGSKRLWSHFGWTCFKKSCQYFENSKNSCSKRAENKFRNHFVFRPLEFNIFFFFCEFFFFFTVIFSKFQTRQVFGNLSRLSWMHNRYTKKKMFLGQENTKNFYEFCLRDNSLPEYYNIVYTYNKYINIGKKEKNRLKVVAGPQWEGLISCYDIETGIDPEHTYVRHTRKDNKKTLTNIWIIFFFFLMYYPYRTNTIWQQFNYFVNIPDACIYYCYITNGLNNVKFTVKFKFRSYTHTWNIGI